jgi:hypothetical protein
MNLSTSCDSRLRSYEWNYKQRHTIGQSSQTRVQNIIARVAAMVRASASNYISCSARWWVLAHYCIYPTNLAAIVKEGDIRHLSEARDGETEGNRKISWNWITEGVANDEASDDVGLQVGT